MSKIGYFAFYGCTGLTSVIIPSSVTIIVAKAFFNCSSLTSLTVYNSTPADLGDYVFNTITKTNCTLYVPIGSKAAYKSIMQYQWKDFVHIEEFTPTGIRDVDSLNHTVTFRQGDLTIANLQIGELVMVCDLQGAVLYRQKVAAQQVSITLLQHGIYVVQVNTQSVKVLYF